MQPQQIESSYNTTTGSNAGYNQASALLIRLETTQLIENIEMFMRGSLIQVDQDDKGNITTKEIKLGQAKANPLGIQAILNYVSSIVNPQVVQGNFPSDGKGHSTMYEAYIEEVHIDLTAAMVNNCYNWEINDDDLDVLIDFIMKLVQPYMTRLIDNLERLSYETTIRHNESNTLKEGPGPSALNIFSPK